MQSILKVILCRKKKFWNWTFRSYFFIKKLLNL